MEDAGPASDSASKSSSPSDWPDPGDHDQQERDFGQKDARLTRKLHTGVVLPWRHGVLQKDPVEQDGQTLEAR